MFSSCPQQAVLLSVLAIVPGHIKDAANLYFGIVQRGGHSGHSATYGKKREEKELSPYLNVRRANHPQGWAGSRCARECVGDVDWSLLRFEIGPRDMICKGCLVIIKASHGGS